MADRQNIQMAIATQAVESLSVLNKSPRALEIWERARESQEEIDQTAKTQRRQAYPEALSAGLIVIAIVASSILKKPDYLASLTQASSQGTNIWTKAQDGKITTHSHSSKTADVARDRLAQTESTTDKAISDLVEHVSRLGQKEV